MSDPGRKPNNGQGSFEQKKKEKKKDIKLWLRGYELTVYQTQKSREIDREETTHAFQNTPSEKSREMNVWAT
jgi:hypothetical protein